MESSSLGKLFCVRLSWADARAPVVVSFETTRAIRVSRPRLAAAMGRLKRRAGSMAGFERELHQASALGKVSGDPLPCLSVSKPLLVALRLSARRAHFRKCGSFQSMSLHTWVIVENLRMSRKASQHQVDIQVFPPGAHCQHATTPSSSSHSIFYTLTSSLE